MSGWILSVRTKALSGGPDLVEYFAVAIPDQSEAIQRASKCLGITHDVKVTAEMQKPAEYFQFLGMKEGEIRTLPVLGND